MSSFILFGICNSILCFCNQLLYFHTIIWPGMLIGYDHDLNLPYDVPANEYLNVEGRKLSKSRRWMIVMRDVLERYEAIRLQGAAALHQVDDEVGEPDERRQFLANLNQDMVGAKQSEGQRVQFMSRTPLSRPSFLNDVVESVVNAVGVDVNTASQELLAYVSGMEPRLAKAVINYRNEHELFCSRKDLHKVPRLGPKAFEQAAGFLRIHDSDNPLDGTAVHPESYPLVEKIASDLGVTVKELMKNEGLLRKLDQEKYIGEKAGVATLQDILEELSRPGRDSRKEFEAFSFALGIKKLEDLQVGMKLPGIVTNVTSFGAFVDIGVHQDGLVHISQLQDGYVKNPTDVAKPRQKVIAKVLDVDLERKRISLSMRHQPTRQ